MSAPNFEAAEMYLAQAREAHAVGDTNKRRASLYMVMVALDLSDASPRIHLGHLKK